MIKSGSSNPPIVFRSEAVDRRHFLLLSLASIASVGGADLVHAAGVSHVPERGQRKVYAHWHWFPTSFDNKPADADIYADYMSPEGSQAKLRAEGGYIRERPLPRPVRAEPNWAVLDMSDEIQIASRIGIDGFQFNIGSIDPDSRYMIDLRNMLEAAAASPSDFRIALSIDAFIMKDIAIEQLATTISRLASHPRIERRADGRLMLGAFAPEQWSVSRWSLLLQALRAAGHTVFFSPTFLDIGKMPAFMDIIDGASMWGVNKVSDIKGQKRNARRATSAGKKWASIVWPQDFRPKERRITEARNSELFRKSWEAAIDVNSDAINICTWNDYSEGSEIRPSTSIQYGFYDLAAFYISWFKKGAAPVITDDVLYYFHRVEATDAPLTGQEQPFRFSTPLLSHFTDPLCNEIELVACLKDAGQIEIETSKGTYRKNVKAGLSTLRAPLAPGRPTFRLYRQNVGVLSITSAFEIREKSPYQNLLYHAGSSSRQPV